MFGNSNQPKTPVVVQGVPVFDNESPPPQHAPSPMAQQHRPYADGGTIETQATSTGTGQWSKGENQPRSCRDWFWALLFYAQIGAIIGLTVTYTPDAFVSTNTGEDYSGVIYATIILGAVSMVLSGLVLIVMIHVAGVLIKFALIFSIIMTLLTAIGGILSGQVVVAIFGFVFFAIGMCYACAVWSRIPFATANLVTAVTAVRANCGLSVVSYFFLALAFGWSILWAFCVVGIIDATGSCDDPNKPCKYNGGYLFLLFISYFWTHQVIQNTVHVTVAGTVGTWWYNPEEATSCCSRAVMDSFYRATTLSFGSICLGSLLVAIIQALRQLVNQARADEGDNILLCLAECLLACIEGLVEYFNKWAYIYVGLYGYTYFEAGKNVMTLFRARGWDNIIADNLVTNALFFTSLGVGLITGGIGLAIDAGQKSWFNSQGGAFLLGFIIGLVLTSVLLSLVGSAVNTVLVCFAEGPQEFQQNHPHLSNKMTAAWRRSGFL